MKKPLTKKQSKLKTPQSLVHVNHNMTLLQYKYWIVFLHHIKDQIEQGIEAEKHGYRYISFNDISSFLGYTPKKSEVYADLKRLRSYSVEYNVLEKDGEKAKVIDGFLYSASVSSKRVGYILPPVFVEAMQNVEDKNNIFHLLNWDIFNSFNGKYEAVIYKLCKDYEGVKRTPYMTIQEFREYIGLKENEYKATDNFTRRCIKNPIKEINKSIISDIKIDVDFKREKRRIVGLYFNVKGKQMTLPLEEPPQTDAFTFAKVTIPIGEQKKYLEVMSEEEIQATIERANEYAETLTKREKKANMGAIYQKAFAERWGVQFLEQKQLEMSEKAQKSEARKKKVEAKKQAEAEAKKQAEAEGKERQEYIDLFDKIPEEVKQKIIIDVLNTAPSFMKKTLKNAHEKHGFDVMKNNVPFLSAYIEMMKKQ